MQGILRRVLALGAVGVASALLGTGTGLAARADSGNGTGQQLGVLAKKIAHLVTKGETSATGALAAAANCGYGASSQLFLPWGDPAEYSLAPEGDLSATDQWSLTDAGLSSDHDPYGASVGSLAFSARDSEAVTPVMCVNLDNPTMRFFVADNGGDGSSRLEVSVLYQAVNGKTRSLALADVSAGSAWQPSPVIPIGVDALALVSADGWTPVAFDFTVRNLQPGETYSVDGIYVDPCRSR